MSHSWEENYAALNEYFDFYGNTRIEQGKKYKGYALGAFVGSCRMDYKKDMLLKIGFAFDLYGDDWDKAYSIAEEYYAEYGDLLIKQRDVYKEFRLGQWISNQRSAYSRNTRKITQDT
ncbi:helicase associated domain-containing protein [Butyrivibrio sp. AE3006]|uniref:helicase associated domain-containing protein n=1 Tax=Butyrivibrio sp. AE3006 TaxID=1280673 RepID=UPI00047E50E6|nr:helicase associated domain-containing protein [Butyrivibrio sp. AE3006]